MTILHARFVKFGERTLDQFSSACFLFLDSRMPVNDIVVTNMNGMIGVRAALYCFILLALLSDPLRCQVF